MVQQEETTDESRVRLGRRQFTSAVAVGAAGLTGAGAALPACAQPNSDRRTVSPAERSLGVGGSPPGDGSVLWNGVNEYLADNWEHPDGSEPGWNETDEFFEVVTGTGNILSKTDIGDCHMHVEWRVPEGAEGQEQERGNSGIFMMNRYENQVLSNCENDTYFWGWGGSQYGEAAPLVSPQRPPGEWQATDIIWRGPRWEDGELVRPGRISSFLNGTLVLFNHRVGGETNSYKGAGQYNEHPPEASVAIQEHSNETLPQFRNVWYQEFPDARSDPRGDPTYGAKHTGRPMRIRPRRHGTGTPASDAFYLLEDDSLDRWESLDGGAPGWRERDGYVSVAPGSGAIQTGEDIGDCQLHLEWRVPKGATGPAGSAVLFTGRYRIELGEGDQDPMETAGAYPRQAPPRVNAIRGRGEWQTLDVAWQSPRFEDGELVEKARLTALVNGVMVQERLVPDGPNRSGTLEEYNDHLPAGPLRLADEDSRIDFRNIWYRQVEVSDEDRHYKNPGPKEQVFTAKDYAERMGKTFLPE